MKKMMMMLAVLGLLACACASFAQGAFVDVPTDHWAYDAVNQLQRAGIIVGYPDGTFGGKRAMTRYEFAVAIARLLPLIDEDYVVTTSGLSQADINAALAGYAKKSDIPAFSGASKADVDAVKRLVNEFGDEIASLGVDVDALKRDVANLTARVEALEAENRRVRFTGDVNIIGIAGEGGVRDQDLRNVAPNLNSHALENITVLKDFDLNIVGRVNDKITANATINYGDYMNYYAWMGDADQFYPYYLYIDADLADNANLTVGRFPMQWTDYTIKSGDWDRYVDMAKTDDGNYALDGVKFDYSKWGIDLTMFAAKNNENRFMLDFFRNNLNDIRMEQSAGARATITLFDKLNLGFSFYQAWSERATILNNYFDQTRVYGADLNIPFGSFAFDGSWTTSDGLSDQGPNFNGDNDAWDVALSGQWSKFGFNAGYKRVENNFYSAGDWDNFAALFNLTDIKGYYGGLNYSFTDNFSLKAGAKFYDGIIGNDYNVDYYNVGLKWGIGSKNTLTAEYEISKEDWFGRMFDDEYITLGWAHKFSPNATLRFAYQFINEDNGRAKVDGSKAVAQFSVSF